MLRPSQLETLGEFVKWYRSKRDLTQVELASDLKLTKQYIWSIEQEKYPFALNFAEQLSTILSREEKEILADTLSRSIRQLIVK